MNQPKYDANYIITSIAFARNLFGQQGMLSSLEIRLKPGSDFDDVKKQMRKLAGDKYLVEDRYEQQADTYKIMNIEKYIAYVFLTFILMVASFNIISSLSMLIIDKKEDVNTLRNLGASNKQISKIFLFEGRMITLGGAILGILLGLLLCWMQQRFGLVALGNSSGSFIVDAYPVSVHVSDVILIFFTVIVVGWIAVWYPIRHLSKRLLENGAKE
jgi:lipoprotein-releasing system permease protein